MPLPRRHAAHSACLQLEQLRCDRKACEATVFSSPQELGQPSKKIPGNGVRKQTTCSWSSSKQGDLSTEFDTNTCDQHTCNHKTHMKTPHSDSIIRLNLVTSHCAGRMQMSYDTKIPRTCLEQRKRSSNSSTLKFQSRLTGNQMILPVVGTHSSLQRDSARGASEVPVWFVVVVPNQWDLSHKWIADAHSHSSFSPHRRTPSPNTHCTPSWR